MSTTNTNSSSGRSRFSSCIELKGSTRKVPPGKKIGTLNSNELIAVTVRLRRKNDIDDYVDKMGNGKGNAILSREEFDKKFGADEKDIELVQEYAHEHDLTVGDISVGRRSIVLKGSIHHMTEAFGVHLAQYQHNNGRLFRGRVGTIMIPAELEEVVEGIFGLDDRPQARPMFRIMQQEGHLIRPAAASRSYNPTDVAKAYNYPVGVNGKGQCIALIELGGGYRMKDMRKYFANLGLPLASIRSVSVDGAANHPSTADSDDGEVVLDIQVAGAVAPGARIVVYFAPNTDQGFLDAITTALHDNVNKPSVISISWGASESDWSQQSMESYNQAFMSAAVLGVTIAAAAGDHGSSDSVQDGKAHVDFPASSPYVLACGGTKLTSDDETVWNDGDGWATGGGISDFFPLPNYQQQAGVPLSINPDGHAGRGVPDIAANADSQTGYNILVDGQWAVVGGTSAVAPLMAGLLALTNQKNNQQAGFVNPKLYTAQSGVFKDITNGNNNTANVGGYAAAKGWDACTGLGVPLGQIADVLQN